MKSLLMIPVAALLLAPGAFAQSHEEWTASYVRAKHGRTPAVASSPAAPAQFAAGRVSASESYLQTKWGRALPVPESARLATAAPSAASHRTSARPDSWMQAYVHAKHGRGLR